MVCRPRITCDEGNFSSPSRTLLNTPPPFYSTTQVISQIRTVRSFAKEDYSSAKYARAIDETHKIGVRVAQYNAIFMGAIGFFPQAAIALVLYYGGMLMMRGEMTGGLLTSFVKGVRDDKNNSGNLIACLYSLW